MVNRLQWEPLYIVIVCVAIRSIVVIIFSLFYSHNCSKVFLLILKKGLHLVCNGSTCRVVIVDPIFPCGFEVARGFFLYSKETVNLMGVWMEGFLALDNRMLVEGMKNVVVLH